MAVGLQEKTPIQKITSPVPAGDAAKRTREVIKVKALLLNQMEKVWTLINQAINEGEYSIDLRVTVSESETPGIISEENMQRSALLAKLMTEELINRRYSVTSSEHAIFSETWLTVSWEHA